jgi:hypothetical protein
MLFCINDFETNSKYMDCGKRTETEENKPLQRKRTVGLGGFGMGFKDEEKKVEKEENNVIDLSKDFFKAHLVVEN